MRARRLGDLVGMLAAVGWSLLVAGAALAVPGLAGSLDLLYLAGVLGIAVLLLRRDPAALFEFAVWLWVIAPGVRRVVDLGGGFSENSVVLLAAPLTAGLCGLGALSGAARVTPATIRLVLRVVLLVAYGAAVALVVARSPVALGLAAVQVLAPLSLGAFAMLRLRRDEVAAVLSRFAVGVPLGVGGYGIVQYFTAPAWDARWLRDVADVATSFGRPFPLEIRVFSTVNDPGSLAMALVFCLLVLFTRRRLDPLTVAAITVGGACLGLTLVRSAWICLAVAMVFLLVRGWVGTRRVAGVAGVLVLVFALSGTALAPVTERFEQTTNAGSQDESFQARLEFQSRYLVPALLSPVGEGLGSVGTAVRRDSGADQSFADTDSGYLELLRTYGGLMGGLLVVSVFAVALNAASRRRPGAEGAAAFVVVMPVQLLFSSVLTGVLGAVFWLAVAWAARDVVLQSTGRRTDDPRLTARGVLAELARHPALPGRPPSRPARGPGAP